MNEKLAILRFPQFTPATLIASRPERVQSFIDAERDKWARVVKASGAKLD